MKTKLDYVMEANNFRGKKELIKYLKGGSITRKQAMEAHCFECMGYYDGGRGDCENRECPVYPFMPYKSGKTKKASNLSDDQKAEIASRMRAGKINKEEELRRKRRVL